MLRVHLSVILLRKYYTTRLPPMASTDDTWMYHSRPDELTLLSRHIPVPKSFARNHKLYFPAVLGWRYMQRFEDRDRSEIEK